MNRTIKRTMKFLKKLTCLIWVIFPLSGNAHHAFNAEFDREMPVEFEGTVTQVQWSNPHARVYVDVVGEDGQVVNWNLELASPNMYMRQGWKKNTLQIGDKVAVTGWRARNDPHVGNVGTIKTEEGMELFSGRARGN